MPESDNTLTGHRVVHGDCIVRARAILDGLHRVENRSVFSVSGVKNINRDKKNVVVLAVSLNCA